jgi:hypothetical protein
MRRYGVAGREPGLESAGILTEAIQSGTHNICMPQNPANGVSKARTMSGMRNDLPFVSFLAQLARDGLGGGPVFLRTDPYAVQFAFIGF